MNQQTAKKIIKHLHRVYDAIAEDFSASRIKPWPEFAFFKQYISEGDSVLELGCGNGRAYEYLKEKKIDYTGIDFSEKLLSIAREKYPEAAFQLQDMADLRIPDAPYDAIMSVASLHHIPSKALRKKVFKKIFNGLKDDGIFIFSVWYMWRITFFADFIRSLLRSIVTLGRYEWNDIFRHWKGTPGIILKRYYHAFTRREMERLLHETGFTIIRAEISHDTRGNPRNYLFACKKVLLKAQQRPVFANEEKESRAQELQPAIMKKI